MGIKQKMFLLSSYMSLVCFTAIILAASAVSVKHGRENLTPTSSLIHAFKL